MFKKLLKNKKAQNTAEYAILISLVVAGVIAMQTYAQRALQARIRDAAGYMVQQSGGGLLNSTKQYEPYYLTTNYIVERDEIDIQLLGNNVSSQRTDTTRTRRAGGFQRSDYDEFGLVNGL